MKLPTPPWKFTNVQRQEKEFKDWINQRLDELAEPTEEDLLREVIMQDYADQEEAYFTKMYRRCNVILSAEKQDVDLLVRLTDDRELRRLAFLELVRKPGRGRKQGQRSKRDLDDVTKAVLQDALDEISDIKRIVTSVPEWKGRWKGCAAIATEIALERASGGNAKLQAKLAKQLETFKSNLSRARKRRRRS